MLPFRLKIIHHAVEAEVLCNVIGNGLMGLAVVGTASALLKTSIPTPRVFDGGSSSQTTFHSSPA